MAAGARATSATRALTLTMLAGFSDACIAMAGFPARPGAVIYVEELPFHHDQLPGFIPEFVMAQLESDADLDQIPHATTRNLVVVLIETGLRGGDACTSAVQPGPRRQRRWPCLRFEAAKVRAEQLIPLSAKAAAAIRAQQDHVRQRCPAAPWPFPGIARNNDGASPTPTAVFAASSAAGSAASACTTKPASRSP